jgi:hypothetical protein
MIRKLLFLSLLAFTGFSFISDNARYQANDNAYSEGEYLKYEAGYGFITGGYAELSLNTKTLNGKEVFYAKGNAKTTGFTDVLYQVNDTYESYFDAQSGLPVYAIEDQHEGPRYKFHLEMNFLHEQNLVKNSKKQKYDTIPKSTFDIVSAVYQLRNSVKGDLKKGQKIVIHTYFQGKNWDLIVRFLGYETVKLDFGKVECYKFLPVVQEGEIFKDENALSIWVSHDAAKIPVKVEFELWVGSFKAELMEYKGLKYPINVK